MPSPARRVPTRIPPGQNRVNRDLRDPVLRAVIGAHLVVAAIILVRSYGCLQPLELATYDQLRIAWAGNQRSSNILLVGGTEQDVRNWHWPLRDGDLARVLDRIAAWEPRVIGVDIYRDYPEPPGSEQLAAVLARHKNIIWAFKLEDATGPEIPAPALLQGTERAVFSDVPVDGGNVVRRALLYADDGTDTYGGIGMGMGLALGYLAGDGVAPVAAPGDQIRLGKALLTPLDDTKGPYTALDSRGIRCFSTTAAAPTHLISRASAKLCKARVLLLLCADGRYSSG